LILIVSLLHERVLFVIFHMSTHFFLFRSPFTYTKYRRFQGALPPDPHYRFVLLHVIAIFGPPTFEMWMHRWMKSCFHGIDLSMHKSMLKTVVFKFAKNHLQAYDK
jgi:hypothetical protein